MNTRHLKLTLKEFRDLVESYCLEAPIEWAEHRLTSCGIFATADRRESGDIMIKDGWYTNQDRLDAYLYAENLTDALRPR